LAVALLEELRGQQPVELVYDVGETHQYNPRTGIWEPISPDEQSRRVQAFAGLQVFGKKRPLCISAGAVHGTIQLARARIAQPRFFKDAPSGLTFRNGFVQIGATGVVLHPHSHEHRSTLSLPFDYDPNSPCPRWRQFLEEVFRGDTDATAKCDCLQEFFGASFIGTATSYAKAVILLGSGRNAKSTLLNIARSAFPENALAAIAPQEWAQEYRRAALDGVRLNCVAEMPSADIVSGEAFKAIVAGDPIIGRPIRQEPRTVYPIAGHVFAANSLPRVADLSRAFWERILIVKFNRYFAPNKRDRDLAKRIVAEERAGIVAWIIDGAARQAQRGPYGTYSVPSSHEEALAEWKRFSDQVAVFLEDETQPAQSLDRRVGGMDLYQAYCSWAKRNGERPVPNNKFALQVKALGYEPAKPHNVHLYPLELRARISFTEAPAQYGAQAAPHHGAHSGAEAAALADAEATAHYRVQSDEAAALAAAESAANPPPDPPGDSPFCEPKHE